MRSADEESVIKHFLDKYSMPEYYVDAYVRLCENVKISSTRMPVYFFYLNELSNYAMADDNNKLMLVRGRKTAFLEVWGHSFSLGVDWLRAVLEAEDDS